MFEVTMSEDMATALGLTESPGESALELAKAAWEKYHSMNGSFVAADCLYTALGDVLRELGDNLHEDMDQHFRRLIKPVTKSGGDLAVSFTVLGESYYRQARDRVRRHRTDLADLAVGLQAIYLEEKYRDRFDSRAKLQRAEHLMDQASELLSTPGLSGGDIMRSSLTDLHLITAKLNADARLTAGETYEREISRMVVLNMLTEARVATAIVLVLVTRALYWFDEWHNGE